MLRELAHWLVGKFPFVQKTKKQPIRRKPHSYRLGFELLEDRTLMAASLTATLYQGGLLRVEGTEAADTIGIVRDFNQIGVEGIKIDYNGQLFRKVDARLVQRIEVNALGGDDSVRLNVGYTPILAPAKIHGGNGNDYLVGGNGNDYIDGGNGNDTIFGSWGNDTVSGGRGADSIYGDGGDDRLIGDLGDGKIGDADYIRGGWGKDSIYGDGGNDYLVGDLGYGFSGEADYIRGGRGADSIYGDGGDDYLIGDLGDGMSGDADYIRGGWGKDSIYGDGGDDYLIGDFGDGKTGESDYIRGDRGKDSIYGDGGNDYLVGDLGDGKTGDNDTIHGGRGQDSIYGDGGNDYLVGDLGDGVHGENDYLVGGWGKDSLFGDGNDYLVGDLGDGKTGDADYISGGLGKDSLYGDGGNDYLVGDLGDRVKGDADYISGGLGKDSLFGDGGDDYLVGDLGDGKTGEADFIVGGFGNDSLYGDGGNDVLEGGVGTDYFVGGAGADCVRWIEDQDRLSGFDAADSIEFLDPSNIRKFAVRPDGSIYTLRSNNGLYVNGRLVWGNTADFSLSADGQFMYWVGTAGRLQKLRFSTWTWTDLLPSNVSLVKYVIRKDGTVFALGGNNGLYVDGRLVWSNTRDFTFDAKGILYWLGTSGLLQRQTAAGWQNLDYDTIKFVFGPDGKVYSLGRDGWLNVEGTAWLAGTRDFAFSPEGRLIWLQTSGALKRQYIDGNWQILDTDAVKFVLGPGGKVYSLGRDATLNVEGAAWLLNAVQDFAFSPEGRLIWLQTSGALKRQNIDGSWQDLDYHVSAFRFAADGELQVLYRNVTYSSTTGADGGSRFILDQSQQSASPALLNPVGKIEAFNPATGKWSVGTGTVLAEGANRYVITAKHVIEGATTIRFTLNRGIGTTFEELTYSVVERKVHGTLDLAVLKLNRSAKLGYSLHNVNGKIVQQFFSGARLGLPIVGREALMVGYGHTGNGLSGERYGTSGTKHHGYSTIDALDSSRGEIVYRYDRGESGFGRGDSGGPDLFSSQRQSSMFPSITVTTPILVGVHSRVSKAGGAVGPDVNPDGTYETRYGHEMRSVAVTAAVQKWVSSSIYDLSYPIRRR